MDKWLPAVFDAVTKLIDMFVANQERSRTEQVHISEKLEQLKTDVEILNAVVKNIDRSNPRNIDEGVKKWKKQALEVIDIARKLIERLDGKNQSEGTITTATLTFKK